MQRGEVWWASLPSPAGSDPGYRRPVLVVQSDPFNSSRIQTVVVVILTSNIRLASAPGNVKIPRGAAGLPKESVANVSQVYTVDRSVLAQRLGRLAPSLLAAVDHGLRLVLSP